MSNTEKIPFKSLVSNLRPHLHRNLSSIPEPLTVPMIGFAALSEQGRHLPNLTAVMSKFGLAFHSYNI